MFLNKRCNYEFITTWWGAEGRYYPVRWELQNNFIMFNLHFPSFIIFIIYAGLQIWFLVQKDQTNLIIANISILSFWLYCIWRVWWRRRTTKLNKIAKKCVRVFILTQVDRNKKLGYIKKKLYFMWHAHIKRYKNWSLNLSCYKDTSDSERTEI